MLLYSHNPTVKSGDVQQMYKRAPLEGVVHSAQMHGERYEMAENFDENWSCAAISWAVDGEETYHFDNKEKIKVQTAGALCLGIGTRYTYSAISEKPFLSNMITFPHWISKTADNSPLQEASGHKHELTTKLFAPDRSTQQLMNAIALACRRGHPNTAYYEEASTLLYQRLLESQDRELTNIRNINAVRKTTKSELHRRVCLAQEFILQSYNRPELSLQEIASHACLSKYHLIRVFKDITGVTPMHFLARIRVGSAMNLLKHTRKSIGVIIVAVGYKDRSAFYRAFTNRFKMPPSSIERPACRRII